MMLHDIEQSLNNLFNLIIILRLRPHKLHSYLDIAALITDVFFFISSPLTVYFLIRFLFHFYLLLLLALRFYLTIYVVINMGIAAFALSRELYSRLRSWSAGRTLFRNMLSAVLYAPMTFYDTTPLGRIINRFSKVCDYFLWFVFHFYSAPSPSFSNLHCHRAFSRTIPLLILAAFHFNERKTSKIFK